MMMTYRAEIRELLVWRTNSEWFTFDAHDGFALTDKAPKEARESFEKWKEYRKSHK